MIKYLLLLCLAACSFSSNAQEQIHKITGIVNDKP